MKIIKNNYKGLVSNISKVWVHARSSAMEAIQAQLLSGNWAIGKYIIEYEQAGNKKAEYGSELLRRLSKDLNAIHGKGFGISNLQYMRLFYLKYPKFIKSVKPSTKIHQTSGKLSWSHYCELLSVSDDLARMFYKKQSEKENWSVRELQRQIDAALFQRLALSKNKKGVLQLAKKGHTIKETKDAIRDPYVFDFLNIPLNSKLTEKGLEKKLIDRLQYFLLELGKGFTFVGRQFKITLDNKHHFIDLVFYHRILKCFILIDLKTRKVKHSDIGQMNLYLNYFREEENCPDDNEPIGIIIAADKHDLLVKYATGGLSNKIFVSKYQLYLPERKLLEQKIREILTLK